MIGTATGDDILYLKSIRVDEVIDYKRERFEDKVRDVDRWSTWWAATQRPVRTEL